MSVLGGASANVQSYSAIVRRALRMVGYDGVLMVVAHKTKSYRFCRFRHEVVFDFLRGEAGGCY